jgi:hypothetical protein
MLGRQLALVSFGCQDVELVVSTSSPGVCHGIWRTDCGLFRTELNA